jgi:hypothetical protein
MSDDRNDIQGSIPQNLVKATGALQSAFFAIEKAKRKMQVRQQGPMSDDGRALVTTW